MSHDHSQFGASLEAHDASTQQAEPAFAAGAGGLGASRRFSRWPADAGATMSVLLGLHQVFGRLRQACQPPAGAVDQLPLALADLDNSGRIRRINRGWSELTGYVARHSLNCLLDDFLHPAERETWALAMQRMRGMAPLNTEVLLLRCLIRTGESRWVEARLRRLADGFIVSLADVSGQMQ